MTISWKWYLKILCPETINTGLLMRLVRLESTKSMLKHLNLSQYKGYSVQENIDVDTICCILPRESP